MNLRLFQLMYPIRLEIKKKIKNFSKEKNNNNG
jgi:hypothetical protein